MEQIYLVIREYDQYSNEYGCQTMTAVVKSFATLSGAVEYANRMNEMILKKEGQRARSGVYVQSVEFENL